MQRPPHFDLRDAEGVNRHERSLHKICQQSFLKLWARTNVYSDEKHRNGTGPQKEVSDGLVVFGKHVLVISDKYSAFQHHSPEEIAWRRWYTKTVKKASEDLLGALRWLRNHPSRIFMDPRCKRRLTIPIPKDPIFHLIAVVRGCSDAVRNKDGNTGPGSLRIDTSVRGSAHLKHPFTLGQQNLEGNFVHVFDEVAFGQLLYELDTAPDFIEYLKERKRAIADRKLQIIGHGEELLLAVFLRGREVLGNEFDALGASMPEGIQKFVLGSGLYDELRADHAYRQRKEAEKASYEWDDMIDHVTQVGGPFFSEAHVNQSQNKTEECLRAMASTSRSTRRELIALSRDAMDSCQPGIIEGALYWRGGESDNAFLILFFPKQDNEKYEEYRRRRIFLGLRFAHYAMLQLPEAASVVAINIEHKHREHLEYSMDAQHLDSASFASLNKAALKVLNDRDGISWKQIDECRWRLSIVGKTSDDEWAVSGA